MSTMSTAQGNAARDAANGLFEVGTGDAYIRIMSAADAVLVSEAANETTVMGTTTALVSTMNIPKAGTAWNATATVPTANGTASYAIITDRNGTEVERLTVSTVAAGTGEVQLGTLAIDTGTTVNWGAAPYVTQRVTPA